MIARALGQTILDRLDQFPAVALLGPRQVGKTTLAKTLSRNRPSLYLDLERPADLQRLEDPAWFLDAQKERLVILDEVQRMPELFGVLRGIIDQERQEGIRSGRYLLLGSASRELLQQSSESLAGRIAYLELSPFHAGEVDPDGPGRDMLWLRGGFPDSFLAVNDAQSMVWRDQFIQTYIERDLPMLGMRLPAMTMRRLWNMIAHRQGGMFNASEVARGLGISSPTVAHYADVLVDLMLVRRLPAWHGNLGKRLVKSPKLYWRDTGILHALLGIENRDGLFGHPTLGASWEGFVLEQVLLALPAYSADAFFYRTTKGVEIDLVLEWRNGQRWAIEIKRGYRSKPSAGFYTAVEDLQAAKAFVVHADVEQDETPLAKNNQATALSWLALCNRIRQE
jgi:predicted AAA+ superfamily ATPase